MTVFKTEHEPNAEVFPPVAVSKHTSTFAGYWKEFGLLLGVEERCVERLNILSLVVWKSGNLEIWKYALNGLIVILLSLEGWKCGNLEMWKYTLNGLIVNVLILAVWKCGNMEIWKYALNDLIVNLLS